MEFFCYHRDRTDSLPLREALLEDHWSYMDTYAKELIARGPVFTDDADETLVGSVHIVDLPDPAAARAFAFDEPCYQAGAYRDVMLRRWRNELGRTMWEFPGGLDDDGDRYFVLGLGGGEAVDLDPPSDRDHLIAYGPLLSDDGGTWLGTAALVRAPDAQAARAVLTADGYAEIEVHRWQCGGRR
ncbi:YciI family protein [Streptomyces sp. NPDC087440]|uniref:YciI family protein n=1 Tax=Streptomyces sp. NPDC087440 TaxID=3365790 RepID=UPI00381A1044